MPDCSAMTIDRCERWFISASAGFRTARSPGIEFNVRGTVVSVRIGSTSAFNQARVPMSCSDGPGSGIQFRSSSVGSPISSGDSLISPAHNYGSYRSWFIAWVGEHDGPLAPSVHGGSIPFDIGGDAREPIFRAQGPDAGLGALATVYASMIGAEEFYILTDVPYIYINYKKPDQEIREFLDYADTLKYLKEGHFAKGSMAPKIEACLSFLEKGGKMAVITEAFKLADKKYGSKITMEYEK